MSAIDLLQFAIEGQKMVKDQLMRIDSTYTAVGTEEKMKPNQTINSDEVLRSTTQAKHFIVKFR